jgi:hypothetical protein
MPSRTSTTPTEMTRPSGSSEMDNATPRWVKVSGAIGAVVLVLFVVLLLIGGHGPGRHTLGQQPMAAGSTSTLRG